MPLDMPGDIMRSPLVNNDASQTALPSLTSVVRSVSRSCETPRHMEIAVATHLEKALHDNELFLRQLADNEKLVELGRLSRELLKELKTPLSVIVSAAQMIVQERALPEGVIEMAERISLEAQRLAQMTKGLHSFALDDATGGTEADVNQVLLEVLAFQEYEARKHAISVIKELTYGIPAVSAETGALKQIFCNLILNAHQAMGSGGFLTIRTSAPSEREVEVVVADTGPGIAPEIASRIFEPFFTTKSLHGGTGLGLYISRNLIENLGGRIRVESVKGSGTSFFITFPACEYDGVLRI